MKRILIGRGKLKVLSEKTGTCAATCSHYLRGLIDETNEEVVANAEEVRKVALSDSIGGVEVH